MSGGISVVMLFAIIVLKMSDRWVVMGSVKAMKVVVECWWMVLWWLVVEMERLDVVRCRLPVGLMWRIDAVWADIWLMVSSSFVCWCVMV